MQKLRPATREVFFHHLGMVREGRKGTQVDLKSITDCDGIVPAWRQRHLERIRPGWRFPPTSPAASGIYCMEVYEQVR